MAYRRMFRGVAAAEWPEVEDEKTIFYTTAQEFVASVPEMIQAGANFIGACCGSDQEFVKAIRKIADTS